MVFNRVSDGVVSRAMASAVSAGIVVVGGGIVGASCAYFLAERHARPLLLESGRMGREASGVNAGGVRQQGRRLPEMPLALESVRLWTELDKRLGTSVEYERCGDMRIAETPGDAARLRQIAAGEERAGLRLEWVEDTALRQLVPALSPHVVAGTFAPTGGQANPLLVAASFGRRARSLGAELREHSDVRGIVRDGAGYTIETAGGVVRADRVVLAAGAWTPGLARHLGVSLPVTFFVPQMVATAPLPPVLGVVLLGVSRRLSMKQTRSGAILIGGGKRGRGDLLTRAKHPAVENIGLSAVDAAAVLPVLARAEATRSWVGLEALTADELPIIDRLPGHEVYVACGFSGHGFAIGPVVGRLLAEWLLDGRPSLDLSAFAAARFAGA
jgi:glycine/D-amino acid oxidase-like deaminating enzyme